MPGKPSFRRLFLPIDMKSKTLILYLREGTSLGFLMSAYDIGKDVEVLAGNKNTSTSILRD